MVEEKTKQEVERIAEKTGISIDDLKKEFKSIYDNPIIAGKTDEWKERYALNQMKVKYSKMIARPVVMVKMKVLKKLSTDYTKDGKDHNRTQLVGIGKSEKDENAKMYSVVFFDTDVDVNVGDSYEVKVRVMMKNEYFVAGSGTGTISKVDFDIDEDELFEGFEATPLSDIFDRLQSGKRWSGIFRGIVSSANINQSASGRKYGILSILDDSLDSDWFEVNAQSGLTVFVDYEDIKFSEGVEIIGFGEGTPNENYMPSISGRYIHVLFDADEGKDMFEHDDDFF